MHRRFLAIAAPLLLVVFVLPSAAHAEFSSTPDSGTVVVNETVTAILPTSSGTYITGDFNQSGGVSATGEATSGALDGVLTPLPALDSGVFASARDGHGGWYIGGSFTTVANASHVGLAHILANGNVDSDFNANLGTGGEVRSLVLSPDGTTLYFNGDFTTVNGTVRSNAAAVAATNGVLLPFNPVLNEMGYSSALSSDGSTYYAGGIFDTVGGTPARALASFATSNGSVGMVATFPHNAQLNTLVPDGSGGYYAGGSYPLARINDRDQYVVHVNADGTVDTNFSLDNGTSRLLPAGVLTLALSPDHTTLYMGGYFNDIHSNPYKLARVDAHTGAWDTSFTPTLDSNIEAMTLSLNGAKLYMGGHFTMVNSETRYFYAALNTADGSLDENAIIPTTNNGDDISAVLLSHDGTKLYLSGQFAIFPQSPDPVRFGILAINTADNSIDYTFDPGPDHWIQSMALSPDDSILYVSGGFDALFLGTQQPTAKDHIAAVHTTDGSLVSAFTASLDNYADSLAVSSDGTKLYVGAGQFTQVNGQTRGSLVELNTSDGSTVTAFNPSLDKLVKAMLFTQDNQQLVAGGNFTTSGGTVRSTVAAFSTANSAVTAFNTHIETGGQGSALALTPNGQTLYMGGYSSGINHDGTYRYLMAFSTSDGSLDTDFDPQADQGVLTILLDGSTLYAGGYFGNLGGQSAAQIGAVNSVTGQAVTAFTPTLNATPNTLAISSDHATLYVGGGFDTVDGTPERYIAAVHTTDGSLVTDFNPSPNGTISTITLSPDNATVFFGGFFDSLRPDINYGLGKIANDGKSFISQFNPGQLDSGDSTPENRGLALSVDGQHLYVSETYVNDLFFSLSPTTGASDDSIEVTVDGDLYSVLPSPDGTRLYLSGRFNSVNNEARNYLAAVSTSDGSVISSFDPEPDDFVPALALSADGSTLYLGGDFTHIGATARNYLGAVHTSDGSVVSGFDPNVTTTGTAVRSLLLSPNGQTLYVSGGFNKIGNVNRGKIGAVQTSNGALISNFNPNANGLVRNMVLSADGSHLYVGGQFTTIAGVSRKAVASLSTTDGTASSFSQTVASAVTGLAISTDGAHLYVGENFNTNNSNVFHVFTDPALVTAGGDSTPPATPHHPQIVSGGSSGGGSSSGGNSSNTGGGSTATTNPSPTTTPPPTPQTPPTLPPTAGTGPIVTSTTFVRSLTVGGQGSDVKTLQQYLNSHGFVIAPSGPGSAGNETLFFGGLTRAALAKFQAAHGISPAVGFFGPITRAYIASHP